MTTPVLFQLTPETAREPAVRDLIERVGMLLATADVMPSRELGLALVHLGTEVLRDLGTNAAERGEQYTGGTTQ